MRQMGGFSGFGRFLAVLGGSGLLVGLMACGAAAAPTAQAVREAAASSAAPATTAVTAATTRPATARPATKRPAATGPARLPGAGNPGGHAYVPPAGRAVNTAHPNHVIGTGTPAGCTSAAVVRDVALGGIITFNCGPKPVTILMTQTAKVVNTRHRIVLDGGGKVTLSGGGKIEILYMDTCDKRQIWTTSNCYDQEWPQLVVQNITFTRGYSGVQEGNGDHPYGGGAIYAEGGQFKAVNSAFINNACYRYGPDLGGAAIRALAQWDNRPVYITDDTFRGGRCSNGGALSSISVQWDVLNSVFTNNKAIGLGANPSAAGTAGGGSGGAIYLDGEKDDVTVAGTIMRNNSAREFGGAIFDVVDFYWGTLTLRGCTLSDNPASPVRSIPGVYYEVDGKIIKPVVIK
jgi:polymorphic membrane protein